MSVLPPLLLLGVPRSGSTWLAEVLACATDRTLVMEPDDAYRWPEAFEAKRGLGDYPTTPMARSSSPFRDLWQLSLTEPRRFSIDRRDARTEALAQQPPSLTRGAVGDGRTRNGLSPEGGPEQQLAKPAGEILVKTVNACLCAAVISEWLGAEVIALTRDLRKVISSWTLMAGFEPEDLHLDSWVSEYVLKGVQIPFLRTRLEKIAWTVATLDLSLKATCRRNSWLVISHEELVEDPHERIIDVLASCGLKCNGGVHEFIDSRRAPGSGFETQRSSEQLGQWEARLTKDQWSQVDAVLDVFKPGSLFAGGQRHEDVRQGRVV